MITVKTILDNITTRVGMYSATPNYFTSNELHVQEIIRLLNGLLNELVSSVNFKDLLESFDLYTYKEWHANEDLQVGDIRYVLTNSIDGIKYKVVEAGAVSTVDPSTINSKKGETFSTADGYKWLNAGDWCEYDLLELIPDYRSLSVNTLINFDHRLPLTAINDEEWQSLRMMQSMRDEGLYQLRGTRLYLFPGYTQNTHLSGFYYSSKPVINAETNERMSTVTSQNDYIILPDLLLELGVAYKWLKQKNLEGWEDTYNTYKELLGTYISISKSGKRIRLDGSSEGNFYMDSNYPVVKIG